MGVPRMGAVRERTRGQPQGMEGYTSQHVSGPDSDTVNTDSDSVTTDSDTVTTVIDSDSLLAGPAGGPGGRSVGGCGHAAPRR